MIIYIETQNGLLSALPYLVLWHLIIVFSWVSDYIAKHNFMSNTNQRKMWNTIALWGGASTFFCLYFFDTTVTGAMVLLTLAVGLNSGIYTGFLINHLDLSPNFAGTLMGITNGLANITSIRTIVRRVDCYRQSKHYSAILLKYFQIY